jgi:hypothetical protein
MEIQLISGTFTVSRVAELLTAIFKTKIAHEQRINTLRDSEEDIMHSEKRLCNCRKIYETLSKK